MTVAHPAPFSESVLDALVAVAGEHLPPSATILDPFAGVGRIHRLKEHEPLRQTYGVELEPEWARQADRLGPTLVGDSTHLAELIAAAAVEHGWPRWFDAIITSPAYGNRMADSYLGERCRMCGGTGDRDNPRDPGEPLICWDCDGCGVRATTRRHTYAFALGRQLSRNSGAALQWGREYRRIHKLVWLQCLKVLRPGGLLVVNISNHIRAGYEQPVVEWHLATLLELGGRLHHTRRIDTPRNRHGANGHLRVDCEHLLVMTAPSYERVAPLPQEEEPTCTP